ncbi:MAG: PhaM family polyhydroxyalkanoate granule multifunctional regulatory protein [Usitatibacter sp.]
MTRPVTPQDMFDMWQKMVNPGAYPLQSLMFPVLDPKELEKKIGELEVVEHWLRANLNMLQLTIKSLQYQRAMVKGGEKFREKMAEQRGPAPGAAAAPGENPAMWAWNMMGNAGKAPPEASPSKPSRAKRSKKAR